MKAFLYILAGLSLCVPQRGVRLRFSWALAATIALCAFVLPGCTAHRQCSDAGVALAIALGGTGVFAAIGLAASGYYRLVWLCAVALAFTLLAGCSLMAYTHGCKL